MKKKFSSSFCVLLLSILILNNVNGQNLPVNPLALSLALGAKKDVTIDLTENVDISTVTIQSWSNDSINIVKKSSTEISNKLILEISGQKLLTKTNIEIKIKVGEAEKKVILPIEVIDVSLNENKISVKQNGKPTQIRLVSSNNEIISGDRVSFNKSHSYLIAEYNNGIIDIKGTEVGEATLAVLVDGITIKPVVNIQISEDIKDFAVPSRITLTQEIPKEIKDIGITIEGTNNGNLTDSTILNSLIVTSLDTNIVKVESRKLVAQKAGVANVSVGYNGKVRNISVEVLPTPKTLEIEMSEAVIYQNKPIFLYARVKDSTGMLLYPTDTDIEWSIPEVGDRNLILPTANNQIDSLKIETLGIQEKLIRVRATLKKNGEIVKINNGQDFTEVSVLVKKDFNITDFAWLKVNMDVIDNTTGKDDWGGQLRKGYFITKVELKNVIEKERENNYYADPILVYNQSLEVGVAFEYKDPDTNQWITADQDLLYDEKSKLGKIIIPERQVRTPKRCSTVKKRNFMLPYRPLDYKTALLTHDSRENRSFRSRFLTGLLSLASMTSFITSIAIPGAGSDLPLGLEKFNNLLIPSYEKLFPNKKETQRNAIVEQMMLPLEEVPFGSQITKHLLFPKGIIEGLVLVKSATKGWVDVPIKITAINGSDACAEVAVIKKVNL